MADLIEPVALAKPAQGAKNGGGTKAGVGNVRPKRAHITNTTGGGFSWLV